MKFSDFIVKEAIRPELSARDRDGVLSELVTALAGTGALPESAVAEVVAALVKREKTGSTGFGKGVAVPHVKHQQVLRMVAVIGRSAQGVDFGALDNQPVFTVVLVLSPAPADEASKGPAAQHHLQAMQFIFSNLQKDNFRRFLRHSSTAQEIVELLDEADQGK